MRSVAISPYHDSEYGWTCALSVMNSLNSLSFDSFPMARAVREDPGSAYTKEFHQLAKEGWGQMTGGER